MRGPRRGVWVKEDRALGWASEDAVNLIVSWAPGGGGERGSRPAGMWARRAVREHLGLARRQRPGWQGTALRPEGGQGAAGTSACPLPPAEKRGLLVKELQGLTAAQRDHMLRGMPLSLAEKRCLRSVPLCLGRPPDAPPWLGGLGGEPAPEPAVDRGPRWGGTGLTLDAASAPREESRPLRGKRRAERRHGLLSCCDQLRDSCVLVGASGPLGGREGGGLGWGGGDGGPLSPSE